MLQGMACGGFGAEVTTNTPPAMKQVLGGAAYSLMGLVTAMKMSPYNARLTTPSGQIHHAQLFVVAVILPASSQLSLVGLHPCRVQLRFTD
jgi:diacylglycerol kinase family enzyme